MTGAILLLISISFASMFLRRSQQTVRCCVKNMSPPEGLSRFVNMRRNPLLTGNFLMRVVIFPARAQGISIFDRRGLRRLRAAGEGAGIHDAGGRSVHGEALEVADIHDRASQL